MIELLSTKVANVYGFGEIVGEVGVEIEVEASSALPYQENLIKYWTKQHDGSLRGTHNAEYIFNSPKTEEISYKAIDYLSGLMERSRVLIDDSVRAGVHVHINVRGLTVLQLWTFITCYYILEETLTDWCGEGRQGNHFCLRAIDADVVLFRLSNAIQNNSLVNLAGDQIRYAALNLNALSKFGSLEFRQLKTPQNFDKIKTWISILLSIKRNSSLFANPVAVVENFSLGGEEEFLRAMLGDNVGLFNYTEERARSLRRGVRVAQEIAYSGEW